MDYCIKNSNNVYIKLNENGTPVTCVESVKGVFEFSKAKNILACLPKSLKRFCKNCNIRMVGVMSFSKDKDERFDRCPKCYSETKHRKINSKELDFGEVLDEELQRSKNRKIIIT